MSKEVLEIAEMEYDVKGKAPHNLHIKIVSGLTLSSNNVNNVATSGKVFLATSSANNNYVSDYKTSVRQFNAGKITSSVLKFPTRIGNITYINVLPTASHLNVLFRHDTIVAHNYDENGRNPEKHYQGAFYFVIKIDLETGNKVYRIIRSKNERNGKIFPHSEGNTNSVFSGCCDGEYRSQLDDAIQHADLSVFMSIFNHYISDGTNRTDTYGRKCVYFTKNNTDETLINFNIRGPLEAKVAAYAISDPEVPFEWDTTNHGIQVRCENKATTETFFAMMQELNTINAVVTKVKT